MKASLKKTFIIVKNKESKQQLIDFLFSDLSIENKSIIISVCGEQYLIKRTKL